MLATSPINAPAAAPFTARADGLQGTTIDLERDLGFGDKNSFRLDGFWRFAPRHKVRLLYFSNDRSTSQILEFDIDFDGETFPVDATVSSDLKTVIAALAYEYAFWRRDSYEISGPIGAHYAELKSSIDLEDDGSGGTAEVRGEGRLKAPLPVVGLHGIWELPYNLNLDLLAQYFYVSINDVDGSITDFRAALNWQPRKWLGFGLAYNQFTTRVDLEKSAFTGELDWRFKGPQAFWSITF